MKSYTVKALSAVPAPDSDWNDPVWKKGQVADVNWFHPASSFRHPRTSVRLMHSAKGLHLFFRVEDRHVTARCTKYQESVCRDSCVEFFVEPPGNRGYFNFEFNAGGVLLLTHITDPVIENGKFRQMKEVPLKLARTMQIHATFKAPITQAIEGPVVWFLQAFIPYSLFEAVIGKVKPAAGAVWRGNFYKCGSDHPHYACWSPVKRLSFHQPKHYGNLVFAART